MTKRSPAQYDWEKALFNDRRLTKHFTRPRRSKIKHVTLHHSTIVSNGDGKALETMYRVWQTRQASAHYGIDGNLVWQYVSDNDAAWSNGTTSNHETLSIEHTNTSAAPAWRISDDTLRTGARLVATLHRLYRLGRPSRRTVKMHRDFAATACPGPYLVARLNDYIAAAQRFYDNPEEDMDISDADAKKIAKAVWEYGLASRNNDANKGKTYPAGDYLTNDNANIWELLRQAESGN